MAQTIQIKRSPNSGGTATPSSLAAGELAYSDNSAKLFIGRPNDGAVLTIGGELYVNMLDHTAGTLTASSAILVDANSKIDKLLTGNIQINNTANQIDTTSGSLILNPTSNLDIDAGTIDLTTQATEFSIIDNSATSFTVTEGTTNYITIDTTNSSEKIKFGEQVEFSGAYTLPTGDGTSGQALITNGSGTVSFTTISTTLDIAGDTGTDTIDLVNDTLTFTGGEGIDTSINSSTNVITIAAEDATSSNKGVASFDATDFTVTSGAVAVNSITLGTSTLDPGATTSTLAGLQQLDVDNVRVDTNTISTTDTNGDLVLSPNGSGTVTVPSGYKNRAGFGTNSLVTKEYVDAIKQALDVKDSVTVATTANLSATYNNAGGTRTNSGTLAALSIDGVSLSAADRVLVKDQSSAAENGIYVVTTVGDGSTAWVLTRSDDANTSAELTGGVFTFVEQGTVGADNGYVFTHNGAPTLGTTSLTVSQFSGAGQIVAGDGLSKSGNTLNANDDNITLEISSDNLRIKGISTTVNGDLLYAANGTDGGYARLPIGTYDSSNSVGQILMVGASSTVQWTNTLDGGTF